MKKHILLVEDDDVYLSAITAILTHEGFRISEASDGETALRMLTVPPGREPPDLLITDIRMPGMDGIALIKSVREHGIHCPVIAVSGDIDRKTTERLYESGCEDYLEKPFTRAELLSKISRVLGNPAQKLIS
ncbi:MAG: response regulator [Desulfococcaceae bacterium]